MKTWFILEAFVVKFIASTDDMFSRIPVIIALTGTRVGKVAFALGNMLAVLVVIALASTVAPFIAALPYFHYFIAAILVVMAGLIYTNVFAKKEPLVQEKILEKTEKVVPKHHFSAIVGAAFTISLVTLIDDAVLFIPLFEHGWDATIFAIIGILIATTLQLMVILTAAHHLRELPYLRPLTAVALVVYAGLIAMQLV